MGQGLKLPRLFRIETGENIFRHRLPQDPGEKLWLRGKCLGAQARRLPDLLEDAKINMRRQILPARVGQQIASVLVAMIGAKRSLGACRRKPIVR